ncbi:glycine--tRNA ligase beta subunit [Striga asiatica]|uniref:Glycine--tRNA ligase beta subunit n=1 Tax=Striga asiatica TaxID=4170 RepID=A0A5A7Q136_STRAF|nr:glycine--tRNA ligase beta subunit [Striga asiatica]
MQVFDDREEVNVDEGDAETDNACVGLGHKQKPRMHMLGWGYKSDLKMKIIFQLAKSAPVVALWKSAAAEDSVMRAHRGGGEIRPLLGSDLEVEAVAVTSEVRLGATEVGHWVTV